MLTCCVDASREVLGGGHGCPFRFVSGVDSATSSGHPLANLDLTTSLDSPASLANFSTATPPTFLAFLRDSDCSLLVAHLQLAGS